MDPFWLWPIIALIATALAVAAVVRFRKRQVQSARAALQQAHATLWDIGGSIQSFATTGEYIPERVRRPFDAKLVQLAERSLPAIAKVARRARDGAMRDQLEGVSRHANELQHMLGKHNDRYVKRMVTEHSPLLVEELRLDEAQREATVRDDYRNLVIAGAGSGKTRTIAARVRFLLERHVPPTAILAVTYSNKATDEMKDRLKQMGVPLAAREAGGVTVSTLHALGKRVVQAAAPGPISVADDRWTDSLVAAALRDARTGQDPRLAQLYINAILHFHRDEDERAPAVDGDKSYRTLRGEHVRSIGERILADFLLLHHVGYKYEAAARWAKVGEGRDAYHPDFLLPEIDAHIEYWGIDRAGHVAGWMDTTSTDYQKGMAWKREQFHRAGKVLLEFYDYERTEGTLEERLRERLTAADVVLRPMTFEELEKALGDMKYVGSAIERLLVQFLANARTLRRTPNEIRQRLDRATPRVHHFGLLGAAVLERYEAGLAAEGHGAGEGDVEQPAFLVVAVARSHAHGLEDVRVLDFGWETEQVVARVDDDDDGGLEPLGTVRRHDADPGDVSIRVRDRDAAPPAGLRDVGQDVVRAAQDEELVGLAPREFLLDEADRAVHERGIVVRDLVHERLAALAAGDHHLLGHLLRVVRDERGARLDDHRGGAVVDAEHRRGRGAEVRLEVDDVVHVGPREAVDRLPVVADGEQAGVVLGEDCLQEPRHGGGRVLVLLSVGGS